jgi:hypothetical protein
MASAMSIEKICLEIAKMPKAAHGELGFFRDHCHHRTTLTIRIDFSTLNPLNQHMRMVQI